MLLTGRTVLISGSADSEGVGAATARLFLEQGARVALLDRQHPEAVVLGKGTLALDCDATDRAACDAAVRQVADAFGQLDILINNAGATESPRFQNVEGQRWKRILDVNLAATFNLSQAVLPYMRERQSGTIACTIPHSRQPSADNVGSPKCDAAKAAVLGLAKSLAREFRPFGIRVNAVAPGLTTARSTAANLPRAVRAELLKNIPSGRTGSAEDIAAIFLFLASDLSAYVSGAVIDVNGGLLID